MKSLFADASTDITGAEVGCRTLPWLAVWWLAGLTDTLIFGTGVAGSIVLLALTAVVCVWWWSRVGRHWHPIRRLRVWRRQA